MMFVKEWLEREGQVGLLLVYTSKLDFQLDFQKELECMPLPLPSFWTCVLFFCYLSRF